MKHFALCNFNCGFLKRKAGEEISQEKFLEMKTAKLDLSSLVRSEGSEEPTQSVEKELVQEEPKKKGKK
jgi:hypothetical protein